LRFSLLLEIQISFPTPSLEQQAFHDAVAQAVAAEEVGFDGVWAVEHHGLLEYSHCSAPEVLLAFIAARTTRIRLGHAVTLTPFRYNHPIRVAERIAALDILSNGRVNWGSGKSASRTEQTAFQIDPAELDGQWREALDMIPRMWRSELFEWNGRYFNVPPTPIIPKPIQQPHPPVFVACSRPETVVTAGTLGVGSLNFTAGTDEQLAAKVKSYRDAIATTRATGRRVNNQFCCTPTALVLRDDRQACEHGFRGSRFFTEGLATYFFAPQRVVGTLDIARDNLSKSELDAAMAARHKPDRPLTAIVGDPVAAREAVARFRATGVDELILVMQMGTIPQAVVLESLKTFGEQVIPYV
jgi:alkanesulfonate monooxygenase SsuD/methylene tetrahydromethanopterin reductase-like flavin-dependent oxidoreductase (luciferase family)